MKIRYLHMNKRRAVLILVLLNAFFIKMYPGEGTVYKDKVEVVVLDAGHGGRDPGALGKRAREKDITLAITLKAGKYIEEAFGDVKVVYTRKKDVFIPLDERSEIANKSGADLFISIHANASPNEKAYGTETFAMGDHKIEGNLEVAKLENSVITFEEDYTTKYEGYDPNSAESFIIFSLLQNTYLDQSLEFAMKVQYQFRERAKRHDRGVSTAGFLVLWKTAMPRVIVETGFITNQNEEKFLMSDYGQDLIASAIFRAFRDYKNTIENRSVFTMDDNSFKDDMENNSNEMISSDEVVFKIQISSSIKEISVDSEFFKGISPIERVQFNGMYKYFTGEAKSYDAIKLECDRVKELFPDAFIVATKNNKLITIQEALKEINH